MEDKKIRGYPVYAEGELGGISHVTSASDTTALEPTSSVSKKEAEANKGLRQKKPENYKF